MALEVKEISKQYGSFTALHPLSFTLSEPGVYALLGTNGAGKTTTLKCLTGMIPYTKGKITICGYDLVKKPMRARKCFSFVTDNHTVFLKMTGYEYLSFMSDVYEVPIKERKALIEELDEVFHLGEAMGKMISDYSHGMKQKICMNF